MGFDEEMACRVRRAAAVAVYHRAFGLLVFGGLKALPEQRSPWRRGLDVGYVGPRMLVLVLVVARIGDAVVVLNGLLVRRKCEVGALR